MLSMNTPLKVVKWVPDHLAQWGCVFSKITHWGFLRHCCPSRTIIWSNGQMISWRGKLLFCWFTCRISLVIVRLPANLFRLRTVELFPKVFFGEFRFSSKFPKWIQFFPERLAEWIQIFPKVFSNRFRDHSKVPDLVRILSNFSLQILQFDSTNSPARSIAVSSKVEKPSEIQRAILQWPSNGSAHAVHTPALDTHKERIVNYCNFNTLK